MWVRTTVVRICSENIVEHQNAPWPTSPTVHSPWGQKGKLEEEKGDINTTRRHPKSSSVDHSQHRRLRLGPFRDISDLLSSTLLQNTDWRKWLAKSSAKGLKRVPCAFSWTIRTSLAFVRFVSHPTNIYLLYPCLTRALISSLPLAVSSSVTTKESSLES